MKLRFSKRMTLYNALITVFITALVGFIVVQGLLSNIISNCVNNVSNIADEVNVMINLSLTTVQSDKPYELLLKDNAEHFAARTKANYALNIIIYDENFNAIGSSLDEGANTNKYLENVKKVYELKQKSYIYTQNDGQNTVVLFCPITVNNEMLGVNTFIYDMTGDEKIVDYAIRIFTIAGSVGAIASLILYFISHTAVTKPLAILAQYFKDFATDENTPFPEIKHRKNDDIGIFINAYSDMQYKINENIEKINIQKNNYENMISSLQEAVITVNPTGAVLNKNTGAKKLFKDADNITDIIPNCQAMINATLNENKQPSCEMQYMQKYYLVSAVPVAIYDNENCVMFIIKDITTVKTAEEEQNRFISSVSHELRTPLTTIIGYVDLLKRRGTDNKELTEKSLATLDNESHRLLRLVDDLLSIGKMNSYEFELTMSDVDLNEIIKQVVNQMNITSSEKNVLILYESTPLPTIKGDKDRLTQCLINIVDNAVKYSNCDEVVRVTAIAYDEYLEITVRDYAQGIPADKQNKVFDAFYRVEEDRTRKTEIGGYGLGLNIVKNIITRHNGTITVDSEEGHGTLVSLRFPISQNTEVSNEENN